MKKLTKQVGSGIFKAGLVLGSYFVGSGCDGAGGLMNSGENLYFDFPEYQVRQPIKEESDIPKDTREYICREIPRKSDDNETPWNEGEDITPYFVFKTGTGFQHIEIPELRKQNSPAFGLPLTPAYFHEILAGKIPAWIVYSAGIDFDARGLDNMRAGLEPYFNLPECPAKIIVKPGFDESGNLETIIGDGVEFSVVAARGYGTDSALRTENTRANRPLTELQDWQFNRVFFDSLPFEIRE